MDQSRNEVRILTVHGAKGLEAPHVFLVDGGGAIAHSSQRPVLGIYSKADAPLYGRECYLWTIGSDNAPIRKDIFDRYGNLAEDEYRRLLYVAMTRAENTLTICGWRGINSKTNGWAEWVKAGLFGSEGQSDGVTPEGIAFSRFAPNGAMAETGAVAAADAVITEPFAFSALPPEPEIPRPLAPSAAALIIEADNDDAIEALLEPQIFISPVLGTAIETPAAMLRGTLVHTLLQRLPDMPASSRTAAAARYIARNAASLSAVEQARIVEEALQVVNNPAFAVLFAEGSKAEVQVSGTVNLRGKNQIIAGKIDRISQTDTSITLIDFKTGRAPRNESGISPGHIVQLALYCQLVAPVFPKRIIKAALVYTSAPKIIYVGQAAMDAALAELGIQTINE